MDEYESDVRQMDRDEARQIPGPGRRAIHDTLDPYRKRQGGKQSNSHRPKKGITSERSHRSNT